MGKAIVDKGVIPMLAKKFDCSTKTISRALYDNYGNKASQIRDAARKDYNGLVMYSAPYAEAVWKDGGFVQNFGEGIYIKGMQHTGEIALYDGDSVVESLQDPTIEELMQMQERAQIMVNER